MCLAWFLWCGAWVLVVVAMYCCRAGGRSRREVSAALGFGVLYFGVELDVPEVGEGVRRLAVGCGCFVLCGVAAGYIPGKVYLSVPQCKGHLDIIVNTIAKDHSK